VVVGCEVIYYANPVVQHTHRHLDPPQRQRITRSRVRAIVRALVLVAHAEGVRVLDAYAMSDARWFASHDGIHYTWSSFSVNETEQDMNHSKVAQPRSQEQWQGGVSWMNAVVLANMLCN
jgi:hypothetical protein